MITHTRLSRFVSEEAGHNTILDVAAHTGDDVFFGTHHHMAIGRAHNDHHPARLGNGGCWDRDVGIHVSNRHRRARLQPGPSRRLFGQPTSLGSQRVYVAGHLLVDDVLHAWV